MRAAFAPIHAANLAVALVALGSAAALGASACAPAPPVTPIGMSDAPAEQAKPPAAEPPRVAWPDFASARAWPEAAPAFVAVGHHRDGSMLHVLVEPPYLAAYRALSEETPMPDGARVVAWHQSARGELLGGYLLSKRSGEWSADELDAKGALLTGDRAPCIRCHDMAPADHLFGPRLAAPASHVSGESIDPQRR